VAIRTSRLALAQVRTLREALKSLPSPPREATRSPLRWTCKSVRQLARELARSGFRLCPHKVADLLHELRYILHADHRLLEGASRPGRDAQFGHIQETVPS
jgi:hypothetical protein